MQLQIFQLMRCIIQLMGGNKDLKTVCVVFTILIHNASMYLMLLGYYNFSNYFVSIYLKLQDSIYGKTR